MRETTKKKWKKILIIGLDTAFAIAAFWGIWSIFKPVPIGELGFSRWWDIPSGAVFTMLFVIAILFGFPKTTTDSKTSLDRFMNKIFPSLFVLGIGLGVLFGLITGIAGGITGGLAITALFSTAIIAGFWLAALISYLIFYAFLFKVIIKNLFGWYFDWHKKVFEKD